MSKGRAALRVVALGAAYSAIGAGGTYAADALTEAPAQRGATEAVDPATRPKVDPATRPSMEMGVKRAARSATGEGRRACAYEVERAVALPVGGAAMLSIDAGSGELVVEGAQGREDVAVTAFACASHEEYLEHLQVTMERVGGEIVLTAHYPEARARGGRSTARLDLNVAVPLGMPVDIDDSSGSMEVSGTGDLGIDDSSGSIEVVGANGSVRVDDSSGGLEIRDVAGDVEVVDGSGEIDVRDVEGAVRIRDGSGSIEVAEVESHVIVEEDGSGSIDVRSVGGDFVVEDDGSGRIRYGDVAGRVDLPPGKERRGG